MDAIADFWAFVTTAEHWWGSRGILQRVEDHARLSAFAVLAAAALALPPAVVLGHLKRGGLFAIWLVNVGRALPAYGLIALAFPISIRHGFGLGFWPTAVALVLLAIPPMFTNTFTGVRDADAGMVEAARGMGMQPREVIWSVELPAALPLIVAGLRVSAVQVVATATLGAYVGFGGLGSYIVEGFARRDNGMVLTGAVLVALMAMAVEVGFSALQRALSPWNREISSRPATDATVDPTVTGEAPTADQLDPAV